MQTVVTKKYVRRSGSSIVTFFLFLLLFIYALAQVLFKEAFAQPAHQIVTLNSSITTSMGTWAKTYGAIGYEGPNTIQQTSDGGFIVAGKSYTYGEGAGDAWILKLNADGTVAWQNSYGGNYLDEIFSIRETSDGNYIAVGRFTRVYNNGYDELWVLRLDPDGHIIYDATIGGGSTESAYAVQETNDGGYIITGDTNVQGNYDAWIIKFNADDTIAWQNLYGGTNFDHIHDIEQTPDGGYLAVGATRSFGAGDYDVWVLKLNGDGSVAWQNVYGDTGYDYSRSIALTTDGGYIVGGSTYSGAGGSDAWVLKLNADGTVAWENAYGGTGSEYARTIQETADGGYIFTGNTSSFGAGGTDVWVMKLNAGGTVAWEKGYGGSGYEYSSSIQQTDDGGFVVAAEAGSFGAGDRDFWILKLDSNGNIPDCNLISEGHSSVTPLTSGQTPTQVTPQPTTSEIRELQAKVHFTAALIQMSCPLPATPTPTATFTATPDPGPTSVYTPTPSPTPGLPQTDHTTGVAWADWDADGDLDLAIGNYDQPVRIYTYENGTFSLGWKAPINELTTSVDWGDWDADGDPDLVVGNEGINRVYENNGNGMNLAWSSLDSHNTRSVAWGDFDDDGYDDLVVGNGIGEFDQLYHNTGGNLLLHQTTSNPYHTTSVAWGDFDHDGDMDLAVGVYGRNRIYINRYGTFSLYWAAEEVEETTSIAWADWNLDGELDLAVGNRDSANRIYENNHTANNFTFSPIWSSAETDATTSIGWSDMNGDGNPDLIVGNYGQPNRIYENNTNNLSLAWSSPDTYHTTSLAVGDVEGDGDGDIAFGNDGEPNTFLVNHVDSHANFTLAWQAPGLENTYDAAWGDYDNDGDLDLVIGNRAYFSSDTPVQIFANDGNSNLTLAWSAAERDEAFDVDWGDFDGDGDLDLAVTSFGDNNHVYRNDGNGNLSLFWTSPIASHASVAWGDYDNDGDLDLAFGNWGEPNEVFVNSGNTFSRVWSSTERDVTLSIVWGDYDNDGDLDLIAGNNGQTSGQPCRLYENVGGSFSLAWSAPYNDYTNSVDWGDMDNDGDLDLAVGNNGVNRVYINDGTNLTLGWNSPESEHTQSVAWGDIDNDGDLDLVAGNFVDRSRIYENTGSDLVVAWTASTQERVYSADWGDWDNDGDLDLVFGMNAIGTAIDSPTAVYVNNLALQMIALMQIEISVP